MSQSAPRCDCPADFARVALLTLAIACVPDVVLAAGPAPGAAAAATAVPVPSAPAAAAPTLYDIVVELGRSEAMGRQVAATLRESANWKSLADKLADPTFAAELQVLEASSDKLTRARYMELVDADTQLRERVREVTDATAAIGSLARKIERDIEHLGSEAVRWPQRAKLARELEAPEGIQRRTETAGPELAALRDRLRVRRDEILLAFERGVDLQSRIDSLRARVAERRERIGTELRSIEGTPIWRSGPVSFPRDEVLADVRLARLETADYLRQHGARLVALLAALGALMYVALRQAPAPGTRHAAIAPRSPRLAVASALLCVVVFLAVLMPRGPLVVYRVVGIAAPLLAGIVATRTFAAPIPATAWTLVFAVFVNEFRVVAEMNSAFARLMLALQLLPFGAALVHDWRRGAVARFLPAWPPLLVRRLVQLVLVMLAAIAVASVLGHAGIARTLTALFVTVPGFALMFAAVGHALDQACAGLLATPLLRSLRSVRDHGDAVLRALHVVVVLFCWGLGMLAFMIAHSALDTLLRAANFIADASVSAGDVTITLSAVLSALAIGVATWIAIRVMRFVLDHEILPRLNLRTGVPIAISTVVGYALAVMGFVLATAALGIDLTKVTLLAGALGIGVGLGLQNVVNNFASGLILMVERPINVGDQIDVGGVLGEVKRIGVRSSTIRTLQGAEVIVPNSDLASKQVTNWTLSDRARRYEIDVGVAYGSDPAQVLRLLEGAAANLPEVQKAPPPRALFAGFGDSSLDFRLFAWVESIDIGLQAQNSLRMAILRALDEAGIEIPFPQRDLHIRYAPPGPAAGPEPSH